MPVNEKLMRIQTAIKAPKNLYNKFGKFYYRNAEGICEAVKPYLEKENCSLRLTDQVVEVGGRVYVKAQAILQDNETKEVTYTEAFARESEKKAGMDDSQITGTASSYARKYALNGLFLLDDTKDADTDEYANQTNAGKGKPNTPEEQDAEATEQMATEKIAEVMVKALDARCKREGVPVDTILSLYQVDSLSDLTNREYRNINDNWEKILEKVNK